jgi:hypothetical protein
MSMLINRNQLAIDSCFLGTKLAAEFIQDWIKEFNHGVAMSLTNLFVFWSHSESRVDLLEVID